MELSSFEMIGNSNFDNLKIDGRVGTLQSHAFVSRRAVVVNLRFSELSGRESPFGSN